MQPPRPWWERARERGLQALDLSLCITSAAHYWANPEGRKVVEIKYDAVGQRRINIHWTDDRVILLQAAFSSSYCSKYLTFSVDSSSTHERIRVRDTSAVAVSIARVKIQTVGNSTHSTMSPFSSDDHPRRSQPGLSCTFKGNRRECATAPYPHPYTVALTAVLTRMRPRSRNAETSPECLQGGLLARLW